MLIAKSKTFSFLLFLLIVFSSLIFRVTNLSSIEFKSDEAIALLLASRPVFGHTLPPFATASSVGILNPPLFTYLIFPAVTITLDPRIISLYIGIINSLAIGFLLLIIKQYYGYKIAFIASLLLAFSPWSIIFSRKIWVPDVILPFMVILIYSIHKIIFEGKIKYWIFFGANALFLLQLHQSSIFFFLLLIIFLFLQKIKINFKYLLIGIFIGLLPAIPYIIYEISNNCPDCSALFSVKEKLNIKYALSSFIRPLQILGQGNFYNLLGNDMLTFAQNFPFAYKLRSIFYVEYFLLPLGILLFWKKYKKLRFFVYTTISLPLLYSIFRIQPFMHYFVILIPFLFIYLALALEFFINFKNKYIKIMSITFFIMLILSSIIFDFSFFNLLKIQKTLNGDYGNTLSANEEKIKNIRKKYNYSKEAEEIVLTSFIPKDNIRGYTFLAKLLYSHEETKKNLPILEKKLTNNLYDIRTQNELIAYYTTSVPHINTIKFLTDKKKQIPGYEPVYRETYTYYASKNFLRIDSVPGLGVVFDIPNHWKTKEGDALNTITINGDEFSIWMNRTNISNHQELTDLAKGNNKTYKIEQAVILNQKVKKTICVYKKKYWCGSWYSPTLVGPFEYQIYYKNDNNSLIDIRDPQLISSLNVMDKIILSLR